MNIKSASPSDDADHSAVICGKSYSIFINTLYLSLKPKTYFKIGTLSGATRQSYLAKVSPRLDVG